LGDDARAWFWVSYLVLWAVVLGEGVLIAVLGRAYSRHLDRSVEGRSEKHGPPIGSPSPSTPVMSEAGRPAVAVFLAAGCGPCTSALPVIAWFSERFRESSDTLVVVRGSPEEASDVEVALGTADKVIIDEDGSISEAWNVGIWPFALALDSSGIVVAKRARLELRDLGVLLKTANEYARMKASERRAS